jgi:hypothetical protein
MLAVPEISDDVISGEFGWWMFWRVADEMVLHAQDASETVC